MDRIERFSGDYRFLSNFYPAKVDLDGVSFSSVEHAYQAAKTLDLGERRKVRNCVTAGEAKKMGQNVQLRPNWDGLKLQVMLDLLRQKFAKPPLREELLATGEAELVEGNTWGDRYWGVVNGVGKNHLGTLL